MGILGKKADRTPPAKVALPPPPKVRRADLTTVLNRLEEHYPDAHCELLHRNPFELVIATVLSAQCTDVLVNRVTPGLFARFPDAFSLAKGDPSEIAELVRSVNFAPTKARNIRRLAEVLVEKHGGQVPRTVPELVELAGVGRKTANVVLGNAFEIPSGIVVDTHVARLSRRFGWTKSLDPVEIENDLCKVVPENRWIRFSHELIFHGRRLCKARAPECASCFLLDVCPRRGV